MYIKMVWANPFHESLLTFGDDCTRSNAASRIRTQTLTRSSEMPAPERATASRPAGRPAGWSPDDQDRAVGEVDYLVRRAAENKTSQVTAAA